MIPRAVLAALATQLAGCTLITDVFLTNDFSGDAFPTNVDLQTGAIVVGIHPAAAPAGDNRDAIFEVEIHVDRAASFFIFATGVAGLRGLGCLVVDGHVSII